MPNRALAVYYTAAWRPSMRTLSSSDGVSWRALMGYTSYERNHACALPSPSPFHYAMAKIVPVVQLATHAKSCTLYGRSYGRTTKFFGLDGLLLFRIIMGLRWSSAITNKCAGLCPQRIIRRRQSKRRVMCRRAWNGTSYWAKFNKHFPRGK